MIIARTITEAREALAGRSVGFVPTMGALHEGHLSLLRAAKAEHSLVAASVFVNPMQFGPNEDLSRYPRPFERDAALCRAAGVDLLFAPDYDQMYGGCVTKVTVTGPVAELWEGAQRPGHFDGVATVVCKLFNILKPQAAYFGTKDLQQCSVVDRMVVDLNIPIELRMLPIIREESGLALSSRNEYLSAGDRETASSLFAALQKAETQISQGTPIHDAREEATNALQRLGFVPQYFAAIRYPEMTPTLENREATHLIASAKLGCVRLLDNVSICSN